MMPEFVRGCGSGPAARLAGDLVARVACAVALDRGIPRVSCGAAVGAL